MSVDTHVDENFSEWYRRHVNLSSGVGIPHDALSPGDRAFLFGVSMDTTENPFQLAGVSFRVTAGDRRDKVERFRYVSYHTKELSELANRLVDAMLATAPFQEAAVASSREVAEASAVTLAEAMLEALMYTRFNRTLYFWPVLTADLAEPWLRALRGPHRDDVAKRLLKLLDVVAEHYFTGGSGDDEDDDDDDDEEGEHDDSDREREGERVLARELGPWYVPRAAVAVDPDPARAATVFDTLGRTDAVPAAEYVVEPSTGELHSTNVRPFSADAAWSSLVSSMASRGPVTRATPAEDLECTDEDELVFDEGTGTWVEASAPAASLSAVPPPPLVVHGASSSSPSSLLSATPPPPPPLSPPPPPHSRASTLQTVAARLLSQARDLAELQASALPGIPRLPRVPRASAPVYAPPGPARVPGVHRALAKAPAHAPILAPPRPVRVSRPGVPTAEEVAAARAQARAERREKLEQGAPAVEDLTEFEEEQQSSSKKQLSSR